jgi:hypothetical protein
VAYFRAGVIHIARDNGLFRANNHAGRFQANVGTVSAVVAFGGCARIRINVDGIIRAGLQTCFAANTGAIVEFDNAICTLTVPSFRIQKRPEDSCDGKAG